MGIEFFTCRNWFLGGETVQVRPCLNSTSPLYSLFKLDIICLVYICIRTNWGRGVDVFWGCSPNPPATGRHSCSCSHLLETQTATSRALGHHFTDKMPWTHGCYTLHCNQPSQKSAEELYFSNTVCKPHPFSKTFCVLRSFQQIRPFLPLLLWTHFLHQYFC